MSVDRLGTFCNMPNCKTNAGTPNPDESRCTVRVANCLSLLTAVLVEWSDLVEDVTLVSVEEGVKRAVRKTPSLLLSNLLTSLLSRSWGSMMSRKKLLVK